MGANIHQHIEVKKDGKWYHYSAPHTERDYLYFGFLSGIRGMAEPVVPLRGLPSDITFVTKVDYEQTKGLGLTPTHEGWIGQSELEEVQFRLNRRFKNTGVNPLEYDLEEHYLSTYINGSTVARHEGWDDVRLVFWFDD